VAADEEILSGNPPGAGGSAFLASRQALVQGNMTCRRGAFVLQRCVLDADPEILVFVGRVCVGAFGEAGPDCDVALAQCRVPRVLGLPSRGVLEALAQLELYDALDEVQVPP
jgi:hypothetical protein